MLKIALLTSDGREIRQKFDPPRPDFGTAPAALMDGFSGLKDVEVHVISCAQGRMAPQLQLAPNITFHSLYVPKIGWLRTGYQGCIRAVRRKLRELQPDIVHGQGTERDCSISAVFSGYANVLTIHGNMRLIAKVEKSRPLSSPWLAARLEGFTVPRSEGVVCITNYTKAAVESLARRTWVLPNAVDKRFFEVQPNPVPDSPPSIFCVGAICHRKNQNNFIRALDSLAKKMPFQVHFFGKADAGDAYGREFLELVATRPWCRHSGFVTPEELKTLFASATLLVLPTLEDNCPMVVLEAAAAGVPVIASRVGGIPDLIEDELTGLFCDPSKETTFGETVERLLTNSGLRQQLAVKARQRALERFHPTIVAHRHIEIYQEVLRTSS